MVLLEGGMKKIFVVKQGGIGDVIIATPIFAELKKLYPDSYLTLMVFPNAVDLVAGLPFIDEVYPYDKKRNSMFELWRKMLGNDMAIFLDLSYRPAMAAALAGVPIRVGLEHKRKIWLTHNVKWQEYMDHIYEPYVFGDILKHIGIDIPRERLDRLYVAPAGQEEASRLHEVLQENGLAAGEGYVVSSPITAYFLKNWPLERWNELYKRIYDMYGLKCVVFGTGELDFAWDEQAVVNLWGRLSLRQVRELIANASLLVNSCSMPVHVAAATGTPCVVLYGFGDHNRWAPRHKCELVVTSLLCSPCDGYYGSKCTEPKCMQQMTVDEVFAAVKRILK